MKKVYVSILAALIFSLLSCSSISVAVHYDDQIDFSKYKTFRFKKPGPGKRAGAANRMSNPLFNKDVMREIKPIMEEKGFREANEGERADLIVVFYAAVKNRNTFVPPTYRVGRWGRVWRTSPGHVVRYKEGTLVIDIVDREKKELIWEGIGRGVLDRSEPAKNLVESVKKILEKFPPEM